MGILKSLGVTRVADLTSKKKKIYVELRKSKRLVSTIKKRGVVRGLFGDRGKINLSENAIIKNIEKLDRMPRLVKVFVKNQLKNLDRSKKSLRYNEEEKALYLAVMKYSPKGYRFLSEILLLPSVLRTLNRSLANIVIKPGVNASLFSFLNAM